MDGPPPPRGPAGEGGLSFAGGSLASGTGAADLFRNAALAVSALLVDPATVRPGGLRDRLCVKAPGLDALMGLWLAEVIRQFTANRLVIAAVHVRRLDFSSPGAGAEIEAEVDGELLDPGRHGVRGAAPVVAAAAVEREGDAWRARASFRDAAP